MKSDMPYFRLLYVSVDLCLFFLLASVVLRDGVYRDINFVQIFQLVHNSIFFLK